MAISQYPAESWESHRRNRNCLPEIAPQGHFLALRAQGATAPLGPRNDKLEGLAPQNACRKDCQLAWRSLSAATDAIGTCYFIDALYGLQMPSRDCHVGLRPPRNDKLGSLAPQNMCRKDCQPARRSLSAATVKPGSVYGRRCLSHSGSAFPRLPRPLRGLAMTTRLAASLNFSICLSLHNLNPPAPAEYRI